MLTSQPLNSVQLPGNRLYLSSEGVGGQPVFKLSLERIISVVSIFSSTYDQQENSSAFKVKLCNNGTGKWNRQS